MSNIDKQALREAAEKTTKGQWQFHELQTPSHSGSGFVAIAGKEAILCFNAPVGGINQSSNVLKYIAAANPATVLALLDELEAKDRRIAEMSALQGKPIAWESTTPVYVKFITDERYQRLRPGYQKWYKPYRCSQCAAAGKGEAS